MHGHRITAHIEVIFMQPKVTGCGAGVRMQCTAGKPVTAEVPIAWDALSRQQPKTRRGPLAGSLPFRGEEKDCRGIIDGAHLGERAALDDQARSLNQPDALHCHGAHPYVYEGICP
jgi:hypothetical protein